ncbi:Hypothetical predicted protein [Cloeon dipterum]|uniref:Rho GTPase-activating protein 100F n=1 Tax=Cloeon dipterum TaxID=197152 RepID=A0A8S1DXJ5_9INSE|nr:Hypothetical predicted protein [Cloeon dipterum]
MQQQQTMGGLRPREPPPMVIQGDFRKVSGISTEIFRQIETVENDHDATTAAALEAVERRGEMVVRMLDPRHMGRAAQDAVKRFLMLQDSKHAVHFVEIVKRPGQTLGLYIREGNGNDRNEGVFISRIALESPVYHSGCLHVSDEILAVNLVDVTRISLDDVVIIMSIPRRLVLTTRRRRGMATGPGGPGTSAGPAFQARSLDMKPAPPVVVMKKDLDLGDDGPDAESTSNGENGLSMSMLRDPYGLHQRPGASATLQRIPGHHSSAYSAGIARAHSQQQLGLNNMGQESDPYLYYNSRPEYARHLHEQQQQQAAQQQQHQSWAPYQPPPPPITTQPKPSMGQQHFQPFDRNYPKTLESLAEKSTASYYPYQVHTFYGGPGSSSTTGRRPHQPVSRLLSSGTLGMRRGVPRSGSDQHLPRVDTSDVYDYVRQRSSHQKSLSGASAASYRGYGGAAAAVAGVPRRRTPSLDYASDTEATTVPRRSYLQLTSSLAAAEQRRGQYTAALQSLQAQHGLRSNSLPRDYNRGRSRGLVRFDRTMGPTAHDYDSDGALSAPEMPLIKRGRVPSSPSIFTSEEYRTWMQRTPSTSAIYDRLRASGRSNSLASDILSTHRPRFTFSAENLTLIDRDPSLFSTLRSSPLTSTLDRNSLARASFRGESAASRSGAGGGGLTSSASSTSLRRMRHLLDERNSALAGSSTALASASAALRGATTPTDPRSRILDINPAEFLKYKMEKSSLAPSPALGGTGSAAGVSGLLWVHLLAGRGLKATPTPGARGALSQCRDLYCVLECDRVHKARTVVRTGELVFEWDETFELDLVDNRQLDLLIYSWDPHFRHKLCYKGSLHVSQLLRESPVHQLALRIEPRGTLYLKLRHTPPRLAFRRNGHLGLVSRNLFGADLDAVVARESGIAAVTGAGGATSASVPVLVRRCIEEVERRGLDIIGLYRLCGSATKKRILREAFERNPRTVDLSPDNVPDINVITGVLKDYLRELPEPLFTKCLYQMLLDALSVCLPDDPEGNAKLMFSILDCLPKVNRCTLIYLMDHLALVVSQSDRNKMVPQNLAVCFGPVLMLQSEDRPGEELDFLQPISVLKYLLEIWPLKSGNVAP